MKRYFIFLILMSSFQTNFTFSQTERTMKIWITKQLATSTNEFKVPFLIHWSYVELPETTNLLLHDFEKNPEKPCNKLEILFQKDENLTLNIHLPDKINNKLLQYLNDGPKNIPFVCLDFVQFLMDIPHTKSNLYDQDYTYADFNTVDELIPGQYVIIWGNAKSSQNKKPVHFAVYLGHSLFLWKSGPTPGLRVSDLRAMKKAFMGNYTQILIRKQKLLKPITIE